MAASAECECPMATETRSREPNLEVELVGDPENVPVSENSYWSMSSWKPTSEQLMVEAEKTVLKVLKSNFKEMKVCVGDDVYMHTIKFETTSAQPGVPLVMVHGFGCGVPQYYKNYDELHDVRDVYSFDLPGFARSSRVDFTDDAQICENEFVEYIERWRVAVGLDEFILLGHSLGGFLSSAYTLKYPGHVRHLVLDDPWGFPSRRDNDRPLPMWMKAVSAFLTKFNPLTPVRLAGPLGPYLVHRFRPDLGRRFGDEFMNYVYHVNAQKPSGETAFFYMQIPFGWARRPMLERLPDLPSETPVTFIYGARSWMDSSSGDAVRERRPGAYTKVHCVVGASHHVHADKPQVFNGLVNEIGALVDNNIDSPPAALTES